MAAVTQNSHRSGTSCGGCCYTGSKHDVGFFCIGIALLAFLTLAFAMDIAAPLWNPPPNTTTNTMRTVSRTMVVVTACLLALVWTTYLGTALRDPGVILPDATVMQQQNKNNVYGTFPSHVLHAEAHAQLPGDIFSKQLVLPTLGQPRHQQQRPAQQLPTKSCATCGIASRPYLSTHCSRCGLCVSNADHHCPWVMNHVAQRNHRIFAVFLLSSVTLCVAFIVTIALFIHVRGDGRLDTLSAGTRAIVVSILVISALMFCLLLSTTCMQLDAISRGRTIKMDRWMSNMRNLRNRNKYSRPGTGTIGAAHPQQQEPPRIVDDDGLSRWKRLYIFFMHYGPRKSLLQP